jgi:ribosome biogenesis GTPase A
MSKQPAKQKGRVASRSSKTSFGRLTELVKWVDLLVEVCDARAPLSSRHPNLDKLFAGKPRLIVLSKADLAEPKALEKWLDYFQHHEEKPLLPLSFKMSKGKTEMLEAVLKATAFKRDELAKKGLLMRPMRICVVGMPNVGKSSLINWLTGKNRLNVADRPGVTKAPQWIRIHPQIELLDTPGILPNYRFDDRTSLKLALLNLIAESTYNQEAIADGAFALLTCQHPKQMANYFGSQTDISLESLAKKRNFIAAGGKLDTRRAAIAFISDLREGKLGKVMLDSIP